MATFQLNRRAVLRGAGSIAIALPWLEAMGPERSAAAASAPARRFLAVYHPGGTVQRTNTSEQDNRWRPTGTETNPILSPILAPFEAVKNKIVIVDGLDMPSAVGEQTQSGMVAWLSGTKQAQTPALGYAQGPSLDQVLLSRSSKVPGQTSLPLAVRWGTGRSRGKMTPWDVVSFADDASFSPIPPAIDPGAIWQSLFGTADSRQPRQWDKSILDFVDRRYVILAQKLGSKDRQKLEQHLEKLRELERRLPATVACSAPARVDTSDYDPAAGLRSTDVGNVDDIAADRAIPKVGKFMLDMMVMAFACDLKTVGTMQWADAEAKYSCPWLDLPETHYYYENGGGYRPEELTKIYTWYSTQHAYMLQEMAKIDMGGHSLLDETVVFFGTEVADPANHGKKNMPFILAGGGGGLRGGRWLRYDNLSHNNLLVSILNLFGDPRTSFGDPAYCTGPLPNLT